ncbi:large terminase protein [Microcystis phage Mel-JY01]
MVDAQYLKQHFKKEYIRCAADPVYFMRKYVKIQHPKKGKLPFNLYDFQANTLKAFNKNRYNVVVKSRQMGISTLIAGYSLWLMLFHTDQNILVIAIKQETAKNLVLKVRVMNDLLPPWLKTDVIEDNKLSVRFKNGSQIKAVSSATESARSEALSLLVIDEAGFIDNIDDIWAAAQQTLATGGSAIINSTPNGVGNFFHKKCMEAKSGMSPFNLISLPWNLHPEKDQKWRDEQDVLMGKKIAAQECDCNFLSSGNSVVDAEVIDWYATKMVCPPIEKRGIEQDFWLWKYAQEDKNYLISADVARGDGRDFSAFHVIDIETMEQVAEYKGKLDVKAYANLLVNTALEYNNALLVVENATIGWATIQHIIDRKYENLYYTYRDDGYIDPAVHITKGYDLKDKSQMVPGFTMSSKTRPLVVSKYEMYFREKQPIIHSERLIEEMFVFIWENSRAGAQSGYNDDLVMSFSIGLYVRDNALRLMEEGLNRTKAALSGFTKTGNIQTTIGTKIYSSNMNGQNWTIKINGKDEDMRWLL